MALFMSQQDDRSELQKRIAQELNDKARKKVELSNTKLPDGVDDSDFLKNTQQTTNHAWIWFVLIALGLVVITFFVIWS